MLKQCKNLYIYLIFKKYIYSILNIYIYIYIYIQKKNDTILSKSIYVICYRKITRKASDILQTFPRYDLTLKSNIFLIPIVKLTPYIGFRQISLDSLTPNQSSNLISENPTTSRLGSQDERKKRGKRK